MIVYASIIATIAGICLGYSLLYFFIGWRRREQKRLNLTFALFAFGYGATLLMGIGYRSADSVERFMAISRWDAIFVVLAFVALNWFVASYTKVGSRLYLWSITLLFLAAGLGGMLHPTMTFAGQPTLVPLSLPIAGQIANLEGEENIWGILYLIAQLVTLGYVLVAGIRQYRRGERQPALILLAGMSWFIVALFYEILGESGIVTYIPLAEAGFLGIAVAMSLQMANAVIKTEEALDESRQMLEVEVADRTSELRSAQRDLVDRAKGEAVSGERNRIARDVHDAVTQTIYSASLIAEVLPQVYARSQPEGERNLAKLRQLVRGALAELRMLLFELRPDALEGAGLETLLPQLADAFIGRTRIPVDVTVTGSYQLPAEVKIALYRISQEALNNIAKHADATQVAISLQKQPGSTTLIVADNGRGFDLGSVTPERMGLNIMRERAAGIGAMFELISAQEAGTSVQIVWATE